MHNNKQYTARSVVKYPKKILFNTNLCMYDWIATIPATIETISSFYGRLLELRTDSWLPAYIFPIDSCALEYSEHNCSMYNIDYTAAVVTPKLH